MTMTAAVQLETISAACGDQLPLPPRGDEQVFAAPWQAQVFAMTLALHEQGVFTWPQWAEVLGRHVAAGATDGSDYYERWADAFTELLQTRGIATAGDIARLTQDWHDAAARTPHGTPIEL
ncbi:nitrile hydratase accessory protein [Ornithinimicrobium faecis]|uniref:Nitrile hydratase accessory protein n=1 Tax=Ornithinimicrobium faecis TaxID=2934158 RepID=A0ABY4YR47_9MICO|nr:nitrile hydratase accessory protein [Ornithinimicrobium sp. HY1793]USQ79216.1 nitrile hydratase accessory protein [Ornithinimicrobium sp. HY1793]